MKHDLSQTHSQASHISFFCAVSQPHSQATVTFHFCAMKGGETSFATLSDYLPTSTISVLTNNILPHTITDHALAVLSRTTTLDVTHWMSE